MNPYPCEARMTNLYSTGVSSFLFISRQISIISPSYKQTNEYRNGYGEKYVHTNCFLHFLNIKQAWPWMLANLKIIWQFHAHPVHQIVSRFFGPRYIADDFFLGPNLVSFNRTVVHYGISKVNFRVETKNIVSMSEEI